MRDEPIVALVADFWDRSGVGPPFPRDLERYIPLVTPVSVVWLADLRPWTVRRWLLRQGVRVRVVRTDGGPPWLLQGALAPLPLRWFAPDRGDDEGSPAPGRGDGGTA